MKYLLFSLIFLCLLLPSFADRLYAWGKPDAISLNVVSKTLHSYDGFDYVWTEKGYFDVYYKGESFGRVSFGLTGTYNGQSYKRSMADFNWTWTVVENSPERIAVRASNNYSPFPWTIDLNVGQYSPLKISHSIKNNLSNPVTNAKLWYLVNVNQNKLPYILWQKNNCEDGNCWQVYDYSSGYLFSNADTNFALYLQKVKFLRDANWQTKQYTAMQFLYSDLIENNFYISNAYFGNLSHLDSFLPDVNGFALGFSKGTGTIPVGTTITSDPNLTVSNDTLDGHIQYQGGAYKAVDNTIIYAGHYGASSKYNWYRALFDFNITGLGNIGDANLYAHISLAEISGETCTFDLNSITTIGAAIDSADWATTVFSKEKDNWFSNATGTVDINTSIANAWQAAISASRTYLDFRIEMDNEASYTNTSNDCRIQLCDTGQTTAGECSAGTTDPYISYIRRLVIDINYPESGQTLNAGTAYDINIATTSWYLATNLLWDINYSSSATEGTGTVIINDGNVASTVGFRCDSNTLTTTKDCKYSWTVPDAAGNYYLLVKAIAPDANTDFNAGIATFTIASTDVNCDAWWDVDWAYDKELTITNNFSSDLNYYQVLVEIDTKALIDAGKLQPDCDDLRFIDGNGIDMNYWIEVGCNTTDTNIWVLEDYLPTGRPETITMYYGNLDATIKSDANKTLFFFDDFETYNTGDLSGQGGWLGDTDYDVNNETTAFYHGTKGVHITSTGGDPIISRPLTRQLGNIYISGHLKARSISGDATEGGYDILEDTNRTLYVVNDGVDAGAEDISYIDSTGWVIGYSSTIDQRWYKVEMWLNSTNDFNISATDDVNGERLFYHTNKKTSKNMVAGSNIMRIKTGTTSGSGYLWWDYIVVRKNVSPAPTVSYGIEIVYADECGGEDTFDFTVSLPASCTNGQGDTDADGDCDRCWAQPTDSLPPINSDDLNCEGQDVGAGTPFLLIAFTGSAATYDLNMDLNAAPPSGLSALAKCDSGDSTGATTLSATTQVICNDIDGDHNIFMWLKFTNYSVSSGLFNVRRADVNAGAS